MNNNKHFKIQYIEGKEVKSQCLIAVSAKDAVNKFKSNNESIPAGNTLYCEAIGQDEWFTTTNVLKALAIVILIVGIVMGVGLMPNDQQKAMMELLGQEQTMAHYIAGFTALFSAVISSLIIWVIATINENLARIRINTL